MKRNNKKGFTIVELVIVIAVIGILAAVLIPTFSGVIGDANATAAKQEARNGYLECYAEDIKDGDVDGKNGTTDVPTDNGAYASTALKDSESATATNKWAYSVTKDSVTYSFDGQYFYINSVKEAE